MTRPCRAHEVLAVLDAIDAGQPAPRPQIEPRRVGVRQKLCRDCNRQIVIARGSNSNWAVLERREPDGDIVIVGGIERERGELYDNSPHFEFHKCVQKETRHG